MANPRKFSEKIALQKQRQQEGTAEFERIMKEVYATKMDETQANQKILECCLVNTDIGSNHATNASLVSAAGIGGGGSGGGGGGGGGVVVNTVDGGGAGNNGGAPNTTSSGSGGASPDGTHNSNSRESRGRSVGVGVGPMRRPSERKQDRSPYGSSAAVAIGMNTGMSNNAYLSPPIDSSWRRSNSDSALHQTLNMAVAAEGGFGPGGDMSGMADMNALHANYQHHNQRSHSPNIVRSFSPQAQRRKGQMLHHQQQQQQQQHLHHSQQHLHLQQQHQQLQQQFQQQQQQQHMHQQQAQQQHVQQHHAQQPASSVSQQQHPQQFNAKYTNCNMPINSLFKSLQEQTLALANTGSLPDLTSLHYSPAQQQLMQQQQQQQQQQTLSPILSTHNNGRERDQSSSPFSPTGGNGNGVGGGPPSPYQQQQHSPTSAANTPTAAQTSPHLSFTNLAVQSPTGNGSNTQNTAQTGTFTNLPTLGAASSTGNLTEYRQPLNPPSPGSSPGLLTSVTGNDVVHISAPASPIRHPQAGIIGSSMQAYNEKNMQAFDRYSPALAGAAPENAGFNSLNSSFHNHFEQFTLGDSNSSPEQQQQLQQHFQQQRQQQQQQQQNSFTTLDFDVFVSGGNGSPYSQSLTQSKQLDFSDLTSESGSPATTTTQSSRGGTCHTNNGGNTSNNNNTHQATRLLAQQMLNNNGAGAGNNANSNTTTNGRCRITNNNVNLTQANEVNSSPIPSPLGCLPSPSSPLPIPINAQSPHHQHQQLSLSLHSHSAQPSPHHSPLHSPHHASPLSSSSPGITTLTGGVSPAPHVGGNGTNNASVHHNQHQQTTQHHQHHPLHQQHQHPHQQNHANTPTNTNIPAIIFSDYSSREIFDSLDLDLSQMDETALDLLADHNSIMIADPTIEDSFRKDLN